MVPDSAAQPPEEAGREYVMVISAPPDEVVICPVNVLTLLLHWVLGAMPAPVMAPDEDTVPEVKRMPWVPLVVVA